ncbi:hypothetical protein FOA43_002040 [Brettanomyces nanus]|uniref:TATA element modulatory factor 1 TATA binding domain-containing protein n=1 Tax=Eeniella nana TaxID=13502 RepID=A0A875RUL6_EENNA|nr:uncharacterized protein FOA43_002040 [Brettanomyces nanus]QPG74707.1 hypothetical protein FOA43_002040 [Brettanomyces nanus]
MVPESEMGEARIGEVRASEDDEETSGILYAGEIDEVDDIVGKYKKKLTLQERLELAAKKGGKGADKKHRKKDRSMSPQSDGSLMKTKEEDGEGMSGRELSKSVFQKKLDEKQKVIDELMEEGTKLSVKEVSLTQTLKKMRQRANDNESELEELRKKNGNMEQIIKEMNREQVQAKEDRDMRMKLQKRVLELEEAVRKLAEERAAAGDIREELSQVKRDNLELERKLKRLQVDYDEKAGKVKQLTSQLHRETDEHKSLVKDSKEEIKRLEEKMETLRIQSEASRLKESKVVDNSSLDLLQAQYTLAQENWKMIESGYQKKIADMEHTVEIFKQRDLEYSKKVKTLSTDVKTRTNDISELMDTENSLRDRLIECEKELALAKASNDALSQSYEFEKADFEQKMQKLVDEKTQLGETLKLRTDVLNDSSQNTNFPPSFYLNDLSSPPIFKQKRRSISSTNISFGESAATPTATKSSSQNQLHLNTSSFSPIQSSRGSTEDDGEVSEPTESSPYAGAATNIRLVSRMSSRVRRLELEIFSLKEENSDLTKMKQEASKEILKLLKDAEQARQYEVKLADCEAELKDVSKNYEATLELLGEKSESCSELQADVADLKDLLHQQVQQMVEMQKSIDRLNST